MVLFEEINFIGYSDRSLYEILNSINTSQQKSFSGLDEFVVDGMEAWDTIGGRSRFNKSSHTEK